MAITWNDDSFNKVSKLNIGGADYYIKDAAAREEIEKLSAYTKFLGVTTTALTDGATTNPIIINEKEVTAKSGDIVIYQSGEFIFNGTAWAEFGDLSGLKDQLGNLAYNDTATGEYTPSGSIKVSGTFVGSNATISTSGTTTGKITVVSSSANGNYTPAGSVDVSLQATPLAVVYSATQGTLPTFSASLLTASVSGEVITFSLVANGFSKGTLPTFTTSNVLKEVTVSSASFSGQKANIGFTGSAATFTGSYTPELASVPTYSFAGSKATIAVSGSQSQPTA